VTLTLRLACVSGALLITAAIVSAVSGSPQLPGRKRLATLPGALGPWQVVREQVIDPETLNVLRADDYVARLYAGPGGLVDLFVAYYAAQQEGDAIHSPLNCLPGAGWQPLAKARVQLAAGSGRSIAANRYIVQKGIDKRLVFYWYQSHGRTVASEYAAKAYMVLDALRTGRSDAALVRVVVPLDGALEPAERGARTFVSTLAPLLETYVPL